MQFIKDVFPKLNIWKSTDIEYNKFTLCFKDANFEKSYIETALQDSIKQQRLSIIIALLFTSMFAFFDSQLPEKTFKTVIFIRFGIIIPLFIAYFFATYHYTNTLFSKLISSVLLIIAGIGFSVTALIVPSELFGFYLAGFLLYNMFCYTLMRIRYLRALSINSVISIIYLILSITLAGSGTPLNLLNSFFILIAVNLIGLPAAYILEYNHRTSYYLESYFNRENFLGVPELTKEKNLSQMKTRFINVVSHLFRTPLTTISNSSFILGHKLATELNIEIKQELKWIDKSVADITHTLERVLFLSKYDSGEIICELFIFDFSEFMYKVGETALDMVKSNNFIRYNFSETPFYSISDNILLRHIVIELITNAINYSPKDSEIVVNCYRSNGNVVLEVADIGSGIQSADHEKLFNAIFRFESDSIITGMGLGLAMVKRCVTLLNGKINIKQNEPSGTIMQVVLPNKDNEIQKKAF